MVSRAGDGSGKPESMSGEQALIELDLTLPMVSQGQVGYLRITGTDRDASG